MTFRRKTRAINNVIAILTGDREEQMRMFAWIDVHRSAGHHCDECSLTLVKPGEVATANTSFGQMLFIVCERCEERGETPNISAKCDQWLARLVSNSSAQFIDQPLLVTVNPQKMVQ